MPQRRTYNNGM